MGLDLNDIKHGAVGAARKAAGAGRSAVKAVEATASAPVATVGRDVLSLGREALGEAGDVARSVGNAVKHVPDAIPTWKRIAHAARTGERTLLPGHMPAYPKLDAAALDAASARGAGRTREMGFIRGEKTGGKAHEPVNLVVTGSRDHLVRALRSQGWIENDDNAAINYVKQGLAVLTRYDRVTEGPVSSMYLDGKLPALAMSKNSDYNLARDHMRVYHLGTDPATGKDRWGIAATRDTAATVTLEKPEREGFWPWQWKMETPRFGHETDHDLDGERDLIMHDLLGSKQVADWAAVRGTAPGAKIAKAEDGRYHLNQYVTDGRVYEVALR